MTDKNNDSIFEKKKKSPNNKEIESIYSKSYTKENNNSSSKDNLSEPNNLRKKKLVLAENNDDIENKTETKPQESSFKKVSLSFLAPAESHNPLRIKNELKIKQMEEIEKKKRKSEKEEKKKYTPNIKKAPLILKKKEPETLPKQETKTLLGFKIASSNSVFNPLKETMAFHQEMQKKEEQFKKSILEIQKKKKELLLKKKALQIALQTGKKEKFGQPSTFENKMFDRKLTLENTGGLHNKNTLSLNKIISNRDSEREFTPRTPYGFPKTSTSFCFKPKEKKNVIKRTDITIYEGMTLQELSNAMSLDLNKIEKIKRELGINSSILTREEAEYISIFLNFNPKKILTFQEEFNLVFNTSKESMSTQGNLIITIAGHVNHGKTTLVENLVGGKDITSREKGKITQTVIAYPIKKSNHEFILIDTPGHDTFISARETAIKLSDLLILVIDLTEGIKAQTKEVVLAARKFNKKIIIALNKMDSHKKIDKRILLNELASLELYTKEMGGDILSVEISALKNKNIDELLELIKLQAEEIDTYKNFDREAVGYFLNSRSEKGIGIVGDILIHNGTIKKQDNIILEDGQSFSIRIISDSQGKSLSSANPNQLCTISPINRFVIPGERFIIVNNKDKNSEIIRKYTGNTTSSNTEAEGRNIIVKGNNMIDIKSVEDAFSLWYRTKKIETKPNIISNTIYELNEKDLELAETFNSIIIVFNAKVPSRISKQASILKINIIETDIIYNILDETEQYFKKKVEMVKTSVVLGTGEVIKVFIIDDKPILGCVVRSGEIIKGKKCIIRRGKEELFSGVISSLKKEKLDIKSAREGLECGIKINGLSIKKNIKENDIIECIEEREVPKDSIEKNKNNDS